MSSTQEKLHEPTILGKMVKDYRKSLGLNQTEFALLFGRTTPTAVSLWESGFREIPGSLCIALIDSAKREGFLEGQLESLGKVTKENFMYRCLYGELPLDYKGVDLLEAYKSYRENDSFRENFARYVEQVAVELEQSEESE